MVIRFSHQAFYDNTWESYDLIQSIHQVLSRSTYTNFLVQHDENAGIQVWDDFGKLIGIFYIHSKYLGPGFKPTYVEFCAYHTNSGPITPIYYTHDIRYLQ